MTKIISKELQKIQNGMKLFAVNILKEDEIAVRTMIVSPLPWESMSKSMRIKYAEMWIWLKQNSGRRLSMLGISMPYPDTYKIADLVLKRGVKFESLITQINPGLQLSVMESLLFNPIGNINLHQI